MKLHKEGMASVTIVLVLTVATCSMAYFFSSWFLVAGAVLLVALLFVLYFFRKDPRHASHDEKTICAPCDGRVVVVEEVAEPEIFGGAKRLQLSIFMSVWNVHMNWYPSVGTVSLAKHHKGKYLVAWLPKSSTENERSSVVINHPGGERILMRQVAGAVARRIVTYATPGAKACWGGEMGFIKFGSRVDLYLPLDAEVLVKVGDCVRGVETPLAKLA